jgi:hypothetical protein
LLNKLDNLGFSQKFLLLFGNEAFNDHQYENNGMPVSNDQQSSIRMSVK